MKMRAQINETNQTVQGSAKSRDGFLKRQIKKTGGFTLFYFKTLKITVIKTIWYWHKDRE